MTDFYVRVSFFTESDKTYKLLNQSFSKKGFPVDRVIDSLSDNTDYLILDFTTTKNIEHVLKLLTSSKVKTISIIAKSQENLIQTLTGINNYGSVAVVEDFEKIDYSESLLTELFSFGHLGKSFTLKGSEVIEIQQDNDQREVLEIIPRVANREIQSALKIDSSQSKKKKRSFKLPTLKLNLSGIKIPIKNILLLTLFILILLSTPLIIQTLSYYASSEAYKNILSNPDKAGSNLEVSKNLNNISLNLSFGFRFYKQNSEIINSINKTISDMLTASDSTRELLGKATGEKIYEVTPVVTKISANLESLYSDLGFLETQIGNFDNNSQKKAKQFLQKNKINLENIRTKIYHLKSISSRIDKLLGVDKAKKYLILYQDNGEIRPTGGKLTSLAIVTFDGGRLGGVDVISVAEADKYLNGFIEPPKPISEIIGETNWYLADSNWDPDFPTSAVRAEWFVEKELDTVVDGVVLIDNLVTERLLKSLGEENSLGSIQTFKNLMTKMTTVDISDNQEITKIIYQAFITKNIQIYVHDSNTQKALKEINFSGSLDFNSDCGLRCIKESIMVVDANMGRNQANTNIKRIHELFIKTDKELINHELQTSYTNFASSVLGESGNYKTYTRLILPVNANVKGVKIYGIGGVLEDVVFEESIVGGRKEIGFLFELLPGSSKKIQFVWDTESDRLSQGGELLLKVYKQAGTGDESFALNIRPSNLIYSASIPALTLTQAGIPVYNTTLNSDLDLKIFFK